MVDRILGLNKSTGCRGHNTTNTSSIAKAHGKNAFSFKNKIVKGLLARWRLVSVPLDRKNEYDTPRKTGKDIEILCADEISSLADTEETMSLADTEAHRIEEQNLTIHRNLSDCIKAMQFEHLPDDVTSLIYSFAYDSKSHFVIFGRRHGFFDSIFYLSKAMQRNSVYFLQNRIQHVESRDIAFICKYGKRVKPKSIKLQVASNTDMAVFLHVLKTCDLSEMHRLELDTTSNRSFDRDERLKSRMIRESRAIPMDEFEKNSTLSSEEFQRSIAHLLKSKARSLQDVKIHAIDGLIIPEILTSCSLTLQELSFTGYHKCFKDSGDLISQIPSLRKLSLEYGLVENISSDSLENLKISHNIQTRKICCPVLKNLDLNLNLNSLSEGIEQMIPSSVEDLSITLVHVGIEYQDIHSNLEQFLERLTELQKLKRLRLGDRGFRHAFSVSIHSHSLQHIDMTLTSGNMKIQQCHCPSMEKIIFPCRLGCSRDYTCEYSDDSTNTYLIQSISECALKPIRKFVRSDFMNPPPNPSKKVLIKHTFQEQDRKFHGLVVPNTCLIEIDVQYLFLPDPFVGKRCVRTLGSKLSVPSVIPWVRVNPNPSYHRNPSRNARGF